MSEAPDFIQPAAGYRAWRLGQFGDLLPFSVNAGAWRRGVNEAACARPHLGGAPGATHRAPAHECTCGFYALHDPYDDRLDLHESSSDVWRTVVGAIAAWGDMEVHRTGFRAQFACVIALAGHSRMPRTVWLDAREAAAHYGVPFVAAGDLQAAAEREAAPLPPLAPSPAPRRRPGHVTAHVGELGVCAERHLWVRHDGREVGIGLTRALARICPPAARVVTVASGTEVTRGETIAAVYGGPRALYLTSPVAGRVTVLSDALRRRPDSAAGDAAHRQWLLRLKPAQWNSETLNLVWGASGRLDYGSTLQERAGRGEDPYAGLRQPAGAPAGMGTWAEARAEVEAERNRPVFRDAEALYRTAGAELEAALAADPGLGSALAELDMTVRYEVTEPEAVMTVDLRPPAPRVACGEPGRRADVSFHLSGNTLQRYRRGQLDVAAAVRRGELGIEGSKTRALMVSSVLGRLWRARSN